MVRRGLAGARDPPVPMTVPGLLIMSSVLTDQPGTGIAPFCAGVGRPLDFFLTAALRLAARAPGTYLVGKRRGATGRDVPSSAPMETGGKG